MSQFPPPEWPPPSVAPLPTPPPQQSNGSFLARVVGLAALIGAVAGLLAIVLLDRAPVRDNDTETIESATTGTETLVYESAAALEDHGEMAFAANLKVQVPGMVVINEADGIPYARFQETMINLGHEQCVNAAKRQNMDEVSDALQLVWDRSDDLTKRIFGYDLENYVTITGMALSFLCPEVQEALIDG